MSKRRLEAFPLDMKKMKGALFNVELCKHVKITQVWDHGGDGVLKHEHGRNLCGACFCEVLILNV